GDRPLCPQSCCGQAGTGAAQSVAGRWVRRGFGARIRPGGDCRLVGGGEVSSGSVYLKGEGEEPALAAAEPSPLWLPIRMRPPSFATPVNAPLLVANRQRFLRAPSLMS